MNSKKKLHIAFPMYYFINSMGGVESVVAYIANFLVAQGHQVSIISYYDGAQAKLINVDLDPKVRLINLYQQAELSKPLAPNTLFKKGQAYLRRQVRKLLKAIILNFMPSTRIEDIRFRARQKRMELIYQEFKAHFTSNSYDLVNVHSHHFSRPIFWELLELTQHKFIFSFHEPQNELSFLQDYDHYDNYMSNIRYKNFNSLSNNIAACTALLPSSRRYFPESLQDKLSFISNMLPAEKTASKAVSKNSATKVILCVSRILERKNSDLLIRAFIDIYTEEYKDWELQLLGPCNKKEYFKYISRQIRSSKCQIKILGMVSEQELEQAYRTADIFAFPSVCEGWGLALSDAMSYALPCIGFADTIGVNFLIEDQKTGILVDDIDRLAGFKVALARLMNNEQLRVQMGQAGKLRVEEFRASLILPQWEDLYFRIANEG